MLALCWRCTVCSSTLSAATHERRSLLDRPSGARGLHFTSSRCSLMAVHSTRRSKHSVSPWRPEMDAYVLLRRFHHHLQKSRVQFSFGGSYRSARYIPSPGALQATYRCRYVAPPEAICSAGDNTSVNATRCELLPTNKAHIARLRSASPLQPHHSQASVTSPG